MLMNVVAVKDMAVNSFLPPVFVPHVGAVIRQFSSSCNDREHDFYKFAGDYELWHLGTWDNDTGTFVNFDSPRRLVRGADVKNPS